MTNEKKIEMVENKIHGLLVAAEKPLATPICWLINPDEGLIFVRCDSWESMTFGLKPKRRWAMIRIHRQKDGVMYLPDLMNATIENYDSLILPLRTTKKEAAKRFAMDILKNHDAVDGMIIGEDEDDDGETVSLTLTNASSSKYKYVADCTLPRKEDMK